MAASNHHLIDFGDTPNTDLAVCKAKGCDWRCRHASRDKRMAASLRHIADMIDPPQGA